MNDLVLSAREKVNAIEAEMLKQPQIALETRHHNAQGVYARELKIPAGVLLTGKIHKLSQINILAEGTIRVLVGDKIVEMSAPQTIVSPPGTKRIALALTNCTWVTMLPTDETDPEKIEREFTSASEEEYQLFLEKTGAQKCLS